MYINPCLGAIRNYYVKYENKEQHYEQGLSKILQHQNIHKMILITSYNSCKTYSMKSFVWPIINSGKGYAWHGVVTLYWAYLIGKRG